MIVRSTLAVLAAALAIAASPAVACRIGGDQLLFDTRPSPPLAKAQVVRVHFTNVGPAYDQALRRYPFYNGTFRVLIGVATPHRGRPFPVSASVTSCTHGFFGNIANKRVEQQVTGRFYLVGRFQKTPAGLAFNAGGDWNGNWHW